VLDLNLGRHADCEGLTRREMLRVGALGAFGLGLPSLLRAESAGKPVSDKRSVILLWMQGGPSHIDTFDPKPDAPAEIRGEFGVAKTKTPGVVLSEHLPKLAKNIDKFSIVRSGYNYNASHGVADAYLMSGFRFNASVAHPTYGSVVAKELGYRHGMPPFVQLGGNVDRRFNGGVAGYLGHEFNPFEVAEDPNQRNFSIDGVALPGGVSVERFKRRRTMLEQVNHWQRGVESGTVQAMDAFYEKAFDIVTSPRAKKAFNLNEEPAAVRDAYGKNRFGQSCLLARRLVESGVRFVTVTDGGWDTHQNNFPALKDRKLPVLDAAYASLIEDLSKRGMLDDTLVIWLGDFGRTPKVNSSAGRDHWAGSTVFCLGGGGVKTGMVVGQSNEYAEQPASDPIQVEDIALTVFTLLGVPLDKHYHTPDGRPLPVAAGGKLLTEMLA
jgi:uncharacterized protein (DUF1501 family)